MCRNLYYHCPFDLTGKRASHIAAAGGNSKGKAHQGFISILWLPSRCAAWLAEKPLILKKDHHPSKSYATADGWCATNVCTSQRLRK